jgi:large subunit ribosomal protein L6
VRFGNKENNMSRIGNAPIIIPKEVSATVDASAVVVKGPKGELKEMIPAGIRVSNKDNELVVTRKQNDGRARAIHGFIRAKLASNIMGVTTGWSKTLQLTGVGYRASLTGANVVLTIGFSHPVTIVPPEGITFSVVEGKIVISGIDKHLVGQIAANVRSVREPEPYKGKGISYEGERIRKKAGKAAKAIGGAPGAAGK